MAQQPQLRQPEWADKERNHQQNRPFCGEYATSTATPSGMDLGRTVGNCRESVLWVQQMLQAACLSNSIIVGFRIFFNPALGAWGIYQPVSIEKGQPISRLPLWVAIWGLTLMYGKLSIGTLLIRLYPLY